MLDNVISYQKPLLLLHLRLIGKYSQHQAVSAKTDNCDLRKVLGISGLLLDLHYNDIRMNRLN